MLLKVDNIYVSYGSFQALHGVSFDVNEGEIVALLGSNGAGKSTTLKTISGQLIQTSGSIKFKDEEISQMPIYERVEKGIVQVPEGRRLFPYLTIEENLVCGSFLKENRKNRKENMERCYEIFPKLYERRKQQAGTLSGGEQQMVAIARGLMSNPKLLMMDEPSLGLAPIVVQGIFDIIQQIHEAGTTVLLIEQNANAALRCADQAYVLETGRITMSGTGEALLADQRVRDAYLGSTAR